MYAGWVNSLALGGAAAASVLVIAHGGIGHVWHRAQLRDVAFKPTALVGDADAAHRFFQVTWHLVTVLFLATAVVLFALAFEAYQSAVVLRSIAVVYVVVIAVCLAYFAPRPGALLKPIPMVASVSMVAIVGFAWCA